MSSDMEGIREWMEGDEIARVTENDTLQFGEIVEKNLNQNSFKVVWKSKNLTTSFDNNFAPAKEKHVRLIDRKHSEGEKVIHMESGEIGEIVQSKIMATIYIPDSRCIIQSVPISLLIPFALSTGEKIFYNGWIGKVSSVEYHVLIEYKDGHQGWINVMQHAKTNTSFGFYNFEKTTPPYANFIIKPTPKEFETMQWLAVGIMDSLTHLMFSHKDLEARVIRSNIKEVHIKWICPLVPSTTDPEPNQILYETDLNSIVDFDMEFKEWMKRHSLCEYTIRENDEGIDESVMENRFIQELKSHSGSNSDHPQPETKRSRQQESYKPPVPGTKHYVEVIRLHHGYWVDWNNDDENSVDPSIPRTGQRLESGCNLSPILIKYSDPRLQLVSLYHREFVLPKFALPDNNIENVYIRSVFGVTQHRDIQNEIYVVDFYIIEEKTIRFLNRYHYPKFELYLHDTYSLIKPGAIVSKRYIQNGYEDNVGTVIGINQQGKVEVHFGIFQLQNTVKLCCPTDLIVRELPKENNFEYNSCTGICMECSLDEEQVKFVECVSNDLREALDNDVDPYDIRIKQISPGCLTTMSALMTGPKDTPYENGLFIFDINIPPQYPKVPPRLKLKSLPPFGAFLSYNFEDDWSVLHPRYKNMEQEDSKSDRWGWTPEMGLMKFLREIREDVFANEPILNQIGLRFKNKDNVFESSTNIAVKAIRINSAIVVTTLDMLMEMVFNRTTTTEGIWGSEIAHHFEMVKPLFIEKFNHWITGWIFGNLSKAPKFHILPLSDGLRLTLARRIKLLGVAAGASSSTTNESAKPDENDNKDDDDNADDDKP